MRYLSPLILAAVCTAFTPQVTQADAEAARPNIIFILCDDLGRGDIGVLWQNDRGTQPAHQTPQLDQLAAEGSILSQHYCPAPVCAPSRASLLLGQHQGHADVRDNQFDKELPDTHTLGTVLQEAGYATAIIGKWGLQGGAGWPGHPLNRGFDTFFGYIAHIDAHHHYPKETGVPFYDGYTDISSQLDNCYSTDLLTARTKKWIQDHVAASPDQPFFTYLAYAAPHAGLRVPTNSHLGLSTNYPSGGGVSGGIQWIGTPGNMINTASGTWDTGIHPDYANATYNGSPWPDYAKRYATMVRRIDDAVADLILTLQNLGIDNNTLIVFTSDNGPHNAIGDDAVVANNPSFFDSYGPHDGIKRDLWEGGIRTPTLVRWPAGIPAGSTSNHPSQFHDWMNTFCELAGVPQPARSDGVSLVPALTGTGAQETGIVYSEYYEGGTTPTYSEFELAHRGQRRNQMQSVFIGDYKGVRYNIANATTPFLVYNVRTDPKETTNLAGQTGVPTQLEFNITALRQRRINSSASRSYDNEQIPPLSPAAVDPGLEFRAVEGAFPWVPRLDTIVPTAEGTVSGIDLSARTAESNIGLRFSGYLSVPASGDYTFFLQTGGRAVVRLHKALLLDADSGYEQTEISSGTIRLQAGMHPVTIDYIQEAAPFSLQLSWQGPGFAKQAVPQSLFFHDTATPTIPEADFFWLPFDENAGSVLHNVSNRIVGSLVGFPTDPSPWITGAHGYALQFDGVSNHIAITSTNDYPPTGNSPRTIAAWLKPDAIQLGFGSWLSYGIADVGQRFTLRVDNSTGPMVLRCEIQGSYILGSTELNNGEWRHVAIVVDDLDDNGTTDLSELRFYVDGINDPLQAGSGSITTGNSFPLTIGDSVHATGYPYAGGIDDVRIYPQALDASTIGDLASRNACMDAWHFRETGDPSPVTADWQTDDGQDGFTRFMEFALGGGVLEPDATIAPQLLLNEASQLDYRFHRRVIGLPVSSYEVEVSNSLSPGSWQSATGTVAVESDQEDPLMEWVTLTPSLDYSAGWTWFLRLSLEMP